MDPWADLRLRNIKGEAVDAWLAGTSGTVVSDYGETQLIEINDDSGEILDLIQVPLAKLDVTWRAAQP